MRGQIVKRGDRTWLLRVFLGYVSGRRSYRSQTIHGTKKEAEAFLRQWIREIETGAWVEPTKVTVGELLDRWLTVWAPDNFGPTTIYRYRSAAELHLKPALGFLPLSKLNLLTVNGFYASKRDEGLSPNTVRGLHRILQGALHAAVRWRLLPANPALGADLPRAPRPEAKALLPGQARTLLDAAKGSSLYTPLLLALTTGLRIGELLGLRWEDINLDTESLSVRRTRARTPDRGAFTKPPKTTHSVRLVELGPDVVRALRQHRSAMLQRRLKAGSAWLDNDLVLPGRNGALRDPAPLNQSLKRLLRKTGLPEISFHGLRHTAATLMLAQGVHPKVVQERLGHASISMTLDLYSHVTPGMQREAAQRVENLLFDRASGR